MASSDDALMLLSMQTLHLIPSTIARTYRITSIDRLIKQAYPLIPSI